jgi:uncharacterized protein YndB with AHSA1/START domain
MDIIKKRLSTSIIFISFFISPMMVNGSVFEHEFVNKINQEMKGRNKIIHQSVLLNCKAHRAFEMFIVNELIESWLTNLAEVEPEIGGKYELFWEPDDRDNNSTIRCKVTAIENDKFISLEWRSPKQYKHFTNNADPLTHVVIFFIPNGENTEVHVIHSGWRNSTEWEEARQWQNRAWLVALKALEKVINK